MLFLFSLRALQEECMSHCWKELSASRSFNTCFMHESLLTWGCARQEEGMGLCWRGALHAHIMLVWCLLYQYIVNFSMMRTWQKECVSVCWREASASHYFMVGFLGQWLLQMAFAHWLIWTFCTITMLVFPLHIYVHGTMRWVRWWVFEVGCTFSIMFYFDYMGACTWWEECMRECWRGVRTAGPVLYNYKSLFASRGGAWTK